MLQLEHLTRRFGAFTALDDLDLHVESGEILALLGENGAGKSTTIGLIGGELAPDGGRICLAGQVRHFRSARDAAAAGIGVVHQHFKLVPAFTVAENLALHAAHTGLAYRAHYWENLAQEWAARLGWQVQPRQRIAALSVGEQQRVEILKALYGGSTQTRLLLLDEPTANLTPDETNELFATLKTLRQEGLAILFVSHKLREVMELCDRAVVLRRGKLVGATSIADTNPAELARLMVGPQEEGLESAAGASGASPDLTGPPDAAALGWGVPESQPSAVDGPASPPVTSNGPNPYLVLHNVSAGALKNVNLSVRPGEIVGVAGVDGNGQQELFDVVAGLLWPAAGQMQLQNSSGAAAKLGLVPPDRRTEGLILTFDIAENLALSKTFRPGMARLKGFDWPAARARARQLVAQFDIRTPAAGTAGGDPARSLTAQLSGGNAQKVVLARALCDKPDILVAVDPTRGLDVNAASFVHSQIRAAAATGAAVLLISTDLDEVLALSHRIGALFAGQLLPANGQLLGAGASRDEVGKLMGGETATA